MKYIRRVSNSVFKLLSRFSLRQVYLTPFRMSFRMHWLMAFLCLILITGCVSQEATPKTWTLEIHDDAPLANLSLVRRVVPEVGIESRRHFWAPDVHVRVVGESRFGDPDEEADLSCIYAGLKDVLPDIAIVPARTFWEQVSAPHDVIKLSKLFVAPQSDRLRELQIDVIVIAYHARIDLENVKKEYLFLGLYSDEDKETAAVTVVDLHRKAIIHGSRITFKDVDFFGHYVFIIPFWFLTSSPSDICNRVARQAGTAIAEVMPDHAIRALVVVAAEDPYEVQSR